MDYILNNMNSLQKLQYDRDLKNSIRRIRVNTGDTFQAKIFELKLNKYYFACGCQSGTIAVYLSMLLCFLLWWSPDFNPFVSWLRIAIIIAISAFVGKLIGLLVSRYRLKKMFRVLEAYYTRELDEETRVHKSIES